MERGDAEPGFSQRHFPFPAHLPEGAPCSTPSSAVWCSPRGPALPPSAAALPSPSLPPPAWSSPGTHSSTASQPGRIRKAAPGKAARDSLRKKRASEPSARATPPTPPPEPATAPSSALTRFRALPTSGLGKPDLRFEGGVPIPSHPAPFLGASWSPGSSPRSARAALPGFWGPAGCASSALGSALGSPPVSSRRRRVASRLTHPVLPGFRTHEVLAALAGSVPREGFRALVPRCEWDLSSRLDMKQFWGTREALCTPAWRPTGILSSWSPVTAFSPAAYTDYFWRSLGCILSFVLEAVCWGQSVECRIGLWGCGGGDSSGGSWRL